ncbi:hypothetical protein I6U48_12970 [Clostridium sp. PL3]|uniref:Uncharacterized protein n=1 Tax=Clostridium thailandense TaxID=2794346 RepID=A0A949TUP8_9CLOT|nr:hypothetical protein [Clostridium thailandense]MBV7273821.1 hypothetical protein [Clostridium thailandense]
MDLKTIKKVEDLTIVNDVNKRLEQGWLLIGTYANDYNHFSYPSETTFHYVVGLPEGTAYVETPQDTNY